MWRGRGRARRRRISRSSWLAANAVPGIARKSKPKLSPAHSRAGRLLQSARHRAHPPDLATVLLDGAIGRELAHAGDIEDGHARPARAVAISVAHAFLARDVSRVVGQQEV